MASIYMRIDGVAPDGAATIGELETDVGKNSSWIAINSYAWGGARNVSMDIGNGTNADSGMVGVSEVNISKEIDGASDHILSFLFNPGKEGKTVEIAFTKPKTDGQGAQVYYQVKLDKARLVSYNVSGTAGAQPYESLSLSYTKISQKHIYESAGGELQSGGAVIFDVLKGVMTAGK